MKKRQRHGAAPSAHRALQPRRKGEQQRKQKHTNAESTFRKTIKTSKTTICPSTCRRHQDNDTKEVRSKTQRDTLSTRTTGGKTTKTAAATTRTTETATKEAAAAARARVRTGTKGTTAERTSTTAATRGRTTEGADKGAKNDNNRPAKTTRATRTGTQRHKGNRSTE